MSDATIQNLKRACRCCVVAPAIWVAHASRVLVIASSRSRAFLLRRLLSASGDHSKKIVPARRLFDFAQSRLHQHAACMRYLSADMSVHSRKLSELTTPLHQRK